MSTREFLGELRLGRTLTTTYDAAAIGLAISIGLLFPLADRVITPTGPRVVLVSVVAGSILALTLLNTLELLGGGTGRGGTFILVHETLGGLGAFLAGWAVLGGCVALTAALAQSAGRHVLAVWPSAGISPGHIGLVVFATVILVQVLQLIPRGRLLWPLVVALYGSLALVVVSALPHVDVDRYMSPPAVPLNSFLRATAWFMAGYAAFEAVLASRRQIRNPGRHLPRALLLVLVVTVLTFGGATVVAVGVGPSDMPSFLTLPALLSTGSMLPGWMVTGLVIVALVVAINGGMMTAARQLDALSREGALPRFLRRVWGTWSMPPLPFAALLLVTLPLIAWARIEWLMALAAGGFLVAITILNATVIQSHRTEPDRRRLFVLPFYPLIPAAAIALNLVLLWALPFRYLLSVIGWLVVGMILWFGYARSHEVEAQEGVLVFGSTGRQRDKRPDAYRILVPLGPGEERQLFLGIAAALAHQLDGEVVPLQVIPVSDPLAIEEGRRVARERNALFRWSTRVAENVGVPLYAITRLARSPAEGILDTAAEEACDLILLPWAVGQPAEERQWESVVDPVIRRAPCDAAVLAYRPEQVRRAKKVAEAALETEGPSPVMPRSNGEAVYPVSRILVPTAGGPHAPLAVRLASLLAREYDASVTAVYVVEPDASDEVRALGEERIQATLDAAQDESDELPSFDGQAELVDGRPVEARLIVAESVVDGIAETGAEYDLVLIGASEQGLLDQVLVGNIPERIARASETPVMVVKRYRGLPRFWLQRTWDAIFATLPTLTQEQRIEVYKEVRRGARPDVDFFIMIGLSAVIATVGLLQNSAAVIIGAMLVAPLFTPIVALSLATVQGNVRLLRLAVESTVKGVALAVGLAVLIGAISPLVTLTAQIQARTHPNLFDLAVALASGAAGAYAIARKDVATALPGVAIAAALVPPISVAGIGLAIGDMDVAGGGALLFITNLIAITLAGSIVLLLLGFRPPRPGEGETRLQVGMITAIALVVIISIPLAAVFLGVVQDASVDRAIKRTLDVQLGGNEEVALAGYEFNTGDDVVDVIVTLYVERSESVPNAVGVSDQLSQAIGRPVRLQLVSIPIQETVVPPARLNR